MFNRLYLKRKFQKNSSEYVCIFIIIIIAVILINVPSIFLDSVHHGEALHYEQLTGGYDVILIGAVSGDEKYFFEVEGITTSCKEGGIYITIDDTVDRDYTVNHISYIVNTNSLDIDVYSQDYLGSAPAEMVSLINVVRIIFTIVGMLSIYFAYNLIIEHRKYELKNLVKLGIERKTLKSTLLIELIIIYIPALCIALPTSTTVVKLLINTLFAESNYYIWIVYDYSIYSFVLLIIYSVLSLVGSFILSWRKIVTGVSGEYYEEVRYAHRHIHSNSDHKYTSFNLFFTKILILRDKKYSIPCQIITTVTITLITFIILYVGAFSSDYDEDDITISVDVAQLYDRADEIENSFLRLDSVPYFSQVDYEIDYNAFVAELNSVKSIYKTYAIINNTRYSHISLTVLDEEYNAELGLYDALVPTGTNMSIFSDGKLQLRSIHELSHNDHVHHAEDKTINIVGTCDSDSGSGFLNVYVSRETFIALTGYEPVKRIAYLKLYDEYDIDTVIEEIHEIFSDETLYSIVNNYQIRQEQMNNDQIIIILMLIINLMIMICGSILIYVFTTLEAIKNNPIIEKMIRIGADICSITIPVILASWLKGVFAYTTGIILSGIAAVIISLISNIQLTVSLFVILSYLLLFILITLLYILPAIIPVKKCITWRFEDDII